MTVTLNGYLRDNPGGGAVSGKTVSLLDVNTGLAPTTTAYTNLSGTTAVTDANGFWQFTMDLMTGPLYVSADLGGGNVRIRRNQEMFIYNSWPISNLPQAFMAINDGVIDTRAPKAGGPTTQLGFMVTPSAVRVNAIDPGYALIKGYAFGWDSGTKSVTGAANGAAGTTRHDFIVLRQWYNGSSRGKQDILIISGSASADPVATTTESDLTKFIRGANIWDLPIARAKIAFGASTYTIEDLRGYEPYPLAGKYLTGSNGEVFGQSLYADDQLNTMGDVNLRDTEMTIDADGSTFFTNVRIATHVVGYASTPSVSVNAVNTTGAGIGATANITGSDRNGQIDLTPAGTPGAGRMCTVTMDNPLPSSTYNINLIPKELDAINNIGKFRALPINASSWEINALAAPSTNQHIWGYTVEGY